MNNDKKRCETCNGWYRIGFMTGECTCTNKYMEGKLRSAYESCSFWSEKDNEDEDGEEEYEE